MSLTQTPIVRLLMLLAAVAVANPVMAQDSGAPALDPAVDAALADALLERPADADADAAEVDPFAAPAANTEAEPAAAGEAADGALALADPEPVSPLQASFATFCASWMTKLAAREERNQGLIDWETGLNWVQGSYVGYTREHKCSIEGEQSDSPVGRLSYLEVKWERRGPSIPEALAAQPIPVETTEVTEFFRYSDEDEWVY